MKIADPWKQIITEQFLKTTIRTPSRFSLPPSSQRFLLEQMCRAFPLNKSIQIRPLRLAGLRAEEIKPETEATQLILHIHGGAFFLGFNEYPPCVCLRPCSQYTNASHSP